MVIVLLVPLATGIGVAAENEWQPTQVITWAKADSPVIVSDSIEIAEDTRLVIESGVEVRLDKGEGIQVRGHLLVQGTQEERVLFTANDTGQLGPDSWESVRLLYESAGRSHRVENVDFMGARTGLLVSSASVLVQDCTFDGNRYGIVARGEADVEVRNCAFSNNTALGLEWEQGATGMAIGCTFTDNVVGVYMYETSGPVVTGCSFLRNYHHVSFAGGSNGTVRSCTFRDATAEAYECYDRSSPLLDDVTIEGQDGDGIHIRNSSRPLMVGGTPPSALEVDSKDEESYVIALALITVMVVDDDGKRLPEANVTILGASGIELTNGTTDVAGRVEGALLSMYTVSSAGGHDRENPHTAVVEWKGEEQTFIVDPRDLDKERVLRLEMDLEPPEPDGWGFIPNLLILVVIAIFAMVIAVLYQRRE
jgi:parallel beta-helix repeat protein